jgi:hypothetical protein
MTTVSLSRSRRPPRCSSTFRSSTIRFVGQRSSHRSHHSLQVERPAGRRVCLEGRYPTNRSIFIQHDTPRAKQVAGSVAQRRSDRIVVGWHRLILHEVISEESFTKLAPRCEFCNQRAIKWTTPTRGANELSPRPWIRASADLAMAEAASRYFQRN